MSLMANKVKSIFLKHLILSFVLIIIISCTKKETSSADDKPNNESLNVELLDELDERGLEPTPENQALLLNEIDQSNNFENNQTENTHNDNQNDINESENDPALEIEPFPIKQSILFGSYHYYQNESDDTIDMLYDPWASDWNQRELVRIGDILFYKVWAKENWEDLISDETYFFVKEKIIQLEDSMDKPEDIVWGAPSIDGDWGWVRFRFDTESNSNEWGGIIYFTFTENWIIEDIQKL